MQECLKRCGFRKITPCPKGWGEPLVTPYSQHSHTPGLPEHVGSGGSAASKCYTWGYRYCRQDDLPGARARLGPAPAHPSRAGSLNFCSCCGSQKGGRIWLKGRLALQPMHMPVWSTVNTFSSKTK